MNTFQHQGKHLLTLLLLSIPVVWFAREPGALEGAWMGVSTATWFWIALAVPIVHQFGTMILWRIELYGKAMTRVLGDQAFDVFQAWFFPGLVARPVSVIALGVADRGKVGLPRWILVSLALAMVPILLYLLYSIVRYFGISRAAGADHFLEEYRSRSLVQGGLFRTLPNAMYVTGFFAVWIPALVLASKAAMLIAAFQHAFIWAHYFYTEKPDMQVIYGRQEKPSPLHPAGASGP